MMELYQIEHCPYCVKVREKLTQLGLSYIIHNRTNPETEKKMIELGGSRQVPFLVDTEKNVKMYESDDILGYLEEHYT